jgi:hypothetical protein
MILALCIVASAVLVAGACCASYRQGYTVAERDHARAEVRARRVAAIAADLARNRPATLEQAEAAILRAMQTPPSGRPKPIRPSPMAPER